MVKAIEKEEAILVLKLAKAIKEYVHYHINAAAINAFDKSKNNMEFNLRDR